MKRGLKRILTVSAILLVGLVALFVWRPWVPPEPVYQGKTLTAWVDQWKLSIRWPMSLVGRITTGDAEAENAIHQIGTNGIPFLLHLLASEEHPIKPWLRTRVPTSWHGRLGLEEHAKKQIETGSAGLICLGTNAGPAVPFLMELLKLEMHSPSPKQFHPSLNVLVLGHLGNVAEPSVPLLIECLTNHQIAIRNSAVHGLRILRCRPEITVPALMTYLDTHKSKDFNESVTAIYAISQFGTNASIAASTLTSLLTDSNAYLRQAATNGLADVDPLAAERAGIRIYRYR